jgi:aminopeptidase N
MVLNMLRFKLGDAVFFQGLKNYLNDAALAYNYAKTPDLQMHLETVSGMNLTEFFNDWIYNQGYPTYTITAHNSAPGQVQISINQTQSHASVSFFEMPVPIRLIGESGQQKDVVLDNSFNGQIFQVDVPFVVNDVIFDPKKDIISKNNTTSLKVGNFDFKNEIIVYPNPVSNRLNLSIPSGITIEKTTIYNTLGQKIKESVSENSWDITNWSKGIYYIKIKTNLGTKQMSFIKK